MIEFVLVVCSRACVTPGSWIVWHMFRQTAFSIFELNRMATITLARWAKVRPLILSFLLHLFSCLQGRLLGALPPRDDLPSGVHGSLQQLNSRDTRVLTGVLTAVLTVAGFFVLVRFLP